MNPIVRARALVSGVNRSTWGALFLCISGFALALRSLVLGLTLSSPVPSYDGWAIVDQVKAWQEGQYGLAELFAQHNEHRIVTTKLTFFVDYLLFHLNDRSVVLVDYALFGILAALLAAVATRGRALPVRLAAGALALAGFWSAAGWINLVWSFQVQWAYVHLTPVLAVAAFAAATARRGPRRWMLLVLACLFDALAVFSMSSGLMTAVPVVAVAVWRRAPPAIVLAFLAVHAGLAALFLLDYQFPPHHLVASPVAVLRYLAPVFGAPFPAPTAVVVAVGAAGLALALAALAWATWAAVLRRRVIGFAPAVLLGAVAFALAEGAATAFGRAGLPNPTQLALRYATPGELLWVALGLSAWRQLDGSGRRAAGTALAAVALCAVAASNLAGGTAAAWKDWSAFSEVDGFNLVNGVATDERGQGIVALSETMQGRIDFLRNRQLGPFAEAEGRFRAPLNSLGGAAPASLPACAGKLDDVSVYGGVVLHVQGWTVTPGVPVSAAWVLVFGADGRLLGYARTWQQRVDEARTAGRSVVSGFAIWLRLPTPSTLATDLVGVFPGGTAPPCRMALPDPRRVADEGATRG